jgi:hypothetical protein
MSYHERQQLRELQTRVRRFERTLWWVMAVTVFLFVVTLTLLIK